MPNTITFGMNGLTDKRLPKKLLATPLSNSTYGYDIANPSPAARSVAPSQALFLAVWNIQEGCALLSSFAIVDAQKIDATGGNSGGVAHLTRNLAIPERFYKDHTNTFAVAGPGFLPIL